MKLLVGLGNPGTVYAQTRHNVGFMAADEIVRRYCFGAFRPRFKGHIAEGDIDGEKTLILKPDTFMNLSGESVLAVCSFYKIMPKDVIVIHDDLDLKPGQLRVKNGGSAGGHNGLKSIDTHIGNNYTRVRIGIGRPIDKDKVADYVLSRFNAQEFVEINELFYDIADCFPVLIKGDLGRFLNETALRRKGK